MLKSNKKAVPVKGQSNLFSFFKKKSTPEPVTAAVEEPIVSVTQCESVFNPAGAPVASTYVVVEDDKSLYVGRSLRVYWPNEKEWYTGKIVSFDTEENTHGIVYEDGDKEELNLDKEKVPTQLQCNFLYFKCLPIIRFDLL
jgi:hypothetical protein